MENNKLLLGIVMLSLIIFMGACSPTSSALEYAERFVTDVIENKNIKDYAAGTVLYNLSTRQSDQQYKIIKIESAIEAGNARWAIVNIKLETENQNNRDVNYYRLYMSNDPSWKVYRIEAIPPIFSGLKSNPDISELSTVFENFMDELVCGNYSKAGVYLVGQAKAQHCQAADVLDSIILIDEYFDLKADLLYAENNIAVTNITYKTGEKNLSVITSFQLTGEGWKIYDISQI